MHQSEHDKVAEKLRDEDREKLIDQYIQQAIQNSDDYGFLNVKGHEVPDPTVMEPPLGYIAQPDLMEQMRTMIRRELSRVAELQEMESFEEADDFDIDEDPVDYTSPYEEFFDPPPGAPAGPTASQGEAAAPQPQQPSPPGEPTPAAASPPGPGAAGASAKPLQDPHSYENIDQTDIRRI